jgi:hypothetical protein
MVARVKLHRTRTSKYIRVPNLGMRNGGVLVVILIIYYFTASNRAKDHNGINHRRSI